VRCPWATPLLAAVVGGVGLTGCLLPQDDNILADLPTAPNQPPSILEAKVQPSTRFFTVDGGADCPPLTFSAPVEEADLEALLYFNFYVDSTADTGLVAQGTIPPSGTAFRTEAATYTVNFAAPGPVQAPGTHFVEVLVADGPLVNGAPVPVAVPLPDGGTALQTTYAVSYVWLPTVTDGGCP